MKKATMQDLIAKRMSKEKKQQETTEIEIMSMGATLCFKTPSESVICELMDEVESGENGRIVAAYKKMIYLCCEQLQDTKLHEELGIVDPFDVVGELLDFVEIMSIGDKLVGGISLDSKVNVIKN